MHHKGFRNKTLLSRIFICFLILGLSTYSLAQETDDASTPSKEDEGDNGGMLDFESPQLEAAPAEEGLSIGPVSNLNLSGLLDLRYVVPDDNAGNLLIHVNELVITANVTDNISLLLEHLLPTSELISLVGDDHGFATAILSNLPLLPIGTALKVGRYRFKYGVDARLDAPANPLYPLVRRNLGFISDLGVELSGFFGPVSYYVSVVNGPDHLEIPVTVSADGQISSPEEGTEGMELSHGKLIVPIQNNSKPVAIRLTTGVIGSLEVGLSYFEGFSWAYENGSHAVGVHAPGGVIDRSRMNFKRRYTADASYRVWKFDLLGEVTKGQDHLNGTRADVMGYYGRVDVNLIPRKVILSGQYDLWDDGRAETADEQTLSGAVTYYLNDQAFLRAAYAVQSLNDSPRPNTGTLQLYLPY